MTFVQIGEKQAMANVIFDTAKAIRKALDDARASYGAVAWDENDRESEVLELVTEEIEVSE